MKLNLSNFQIHKEGAVDIPEGETTYLEGDSDTGKSSKLRAIRWLCENKPDGGSFVTFKTPRGTNAAVALEIDGHIITRERGKSKNVYSLDGEKFEAFGRSVPEPILKVLRLSPYAFQLQGEPPFLIGFTPTEAAKTLSDACGLGVIDTAVEFVRGKKTAADAEIRKSEILLESAEHKLTSAEANIPLANALDTAAELEEAVAELKKRASEVADAIDDAPEGKALDVDAVRSQVILARSAHDALEQLEIEASRIRAAIVDAPAGTMFEVEAVRGPLDRARVLSVDVAELTNKIAAIRRALADEPTGVVRYVDPVRPLLSLARVCGEWLTDMNKIAAQMRLTIAQVPTGEPFDLARARLAHMTAKAAYNDAAELRGMHDRVRAALLDAPMGVAEDTTELLKLRAQIKVCPTCGREM